MEEEYHKQESLTSVNESDKVLHLRGSGSHRYVGLKRSISQDPLLDPRAVGGPFEVILPSRKYDGDYEGERVEWLPNGQTVDAADDARSGPDVDQKIEKIVDENQDSSKSLFEKIHAVLPTSNIAFGMVGTGQGM